MQRREAIEIFREIWKCIPDSFVSCVTLLPIDRFEMEFALRISVALDEGHLRSLKALIHKHGLTLKEDNGALLIFRSNPELDEIQVIA